MVETQQSSAIVEVSHVTVWCVCVINSITDGLRARKTNLIDRLIIVIIRLTCCELEQKTLSFSKQLHVLATVVSASATICLCPVNKLCSNEESPSFSSFVYSTVTNACDPTCRHWGGGD